MDRRGALFIRLGAAAVMLPLLLLAGFELRSAADPGSGSAGPAPVAADEGREAARDAAPVADVPAVTVSASVPGDAALAGDDPGFAVAGAAAALRDRIDATVPARRWRGAEWGLLVTSLDRGDTLYAANAHRPLAPASNVKLLTTAAALHHLGPDYRFRTFLLSDATVADGVLRGDLVLYGTGDPTIADPSREGAGPFRRMARTLREQGVRAIDGDLVGDGSYFGEGLHPPGWGAAHLIDWFAAPVGALQFNENLATLRIRPGRTLGSAVRVETIPAGAPVPVRVQARTVSRRTSHPIWAIRSDPSGPVEITGQIRPSDRDVWRRVPVDDPARYAASALGEALEREGIRVGGEPRVVRDRGSSLAGGAGLSAPTLGSGPGHRILAEHRSEPLLEILNAINRKSNNLYAETVLRTLGRVVAGDASFESGAEVVRRFAVEEVGAPAAEVRPVDGSGLSPDNRVSPFVFVRVLDHMAESDHWSEFRSTLPQAGTRHELGRMYRTDAAGNLRAKTGTIERVSALSGVVRALDGERLAFSILSNGVPSTGAAKRIEDRIGVHLASFRRAPGTAGATLADQD